MGPFLLDQIFTSFSHQHKLPCLSITEQIFTNCLGPVLTFKPRFY